MKEISQFEHQPRKSTGVPEVFDRITSGCLHIGKYRNETIYAIEVINCDVNSCFVSNRRKVNQCIGGPPSGGVNDNGVLERFSRQDVAGPDVFLDQVDAAFSGGPCVAQMLG